MSDRTGQTCQTGPTGQTGPTRQTDRTRQDRTGPGMTGQDRTGQDRQSGLHGPLPHLVSFVRPSDSSSSSSSSPHWFIGLSFLPVALVHRLVLFARCKSSCPVLLSIRICIFFCLLLFLPLSPSSFAWFFFCGLGAGLRIPCTSSTRPTPPSAI